MAVKMDAIITTEFADLNLVHRGKVRDMYAIPGHDDKLLMVATDRISAYDVVMNAPIPGKGKILTQISLFWFDLLGDVVDNHLISANVQDYPDVCRQEVFEFLGSRRPGRVVCQIRQFQAPGRGGGGSYPCSGTPCGCRPR